MEVKPKIENNKTEPNSFSNGFSPDSRVKETRYQDTNLKEKYNVDNRLDGFNSTRKQRLDITPVDGPKGYWEGDRGESKFITTNKEVKAALKKYGVDGIKYTDCIPNFDPVSKGTVEIDKMTPNKSENFKKGYIAMAEKWNKENFNGKSDWSIQSVKEYKKDNNLDFHECADGKTMQFVEHDIHMTFKHRGGRSEAKLMQGGNNFDK